VRYDKTIAFFSVLLIEVLINSLRKKFSAFYTHEHFLAEEPRSSSVQLKQLVSPVCSSNRARNAEFDLVPYSYSKDIAQALARLSWEIEVPVGSRFSVSSFSGLSAAKGKKIFLDLAYCVA